jgi:hypothetical protein
MAYSKAKLKCSGDGASPCFRPFWIGTISDKCLPIQTLLYVSFKHILIKCFSLLWVNASCCVVTMNKYKNPLFVTK